MKSSGKRQPVLVNFSRDTQSASIAVAFAAWMVAACLLVAAAALFLQSRTYAETEAKASAQADKLASELAALGEAASAGEPSASAAALLKQRIASFSALDYGSAPQAARVLLALEEILPPSVALQTLSYDRANAALELLAASESSEDLTAFFEAASRNPLFKAVQITEKKEAGASERGANLFQLRLSMRPANPEG
jgi:Tfp pilus assembly protein PilN